VDYLLELIVLPVADIDRAKSFYEHAGFHVDVDFSAGEDFRVVQLTPPGSACSIGLMRNVELAGSVKGLQVVVADIEAARSELAGRGVPVSELFHFDAGGRAEGASAGRADYETFCEFEDPDGNTWLLQEVPSRAS
jgi:catechol 2,3-dioxygenase-like lactoylglutathione lyase family enzyme